jgi:exodeoxyribonuclease VII small subunit
MSNEYNFEETFAELNSLAKELEIGDETLEKSIKTYKKAMDLAAICEKKISEAAQQVKILGAE